MNSQERKSPRIFKRNPAFVLSLFILISMTLIFYGCSDSSTGSPPGGNGNNGGNNNGGNEIGMEPTFANVQQIFTQNCGNCHIGGTQNGVRLDSYDNVMNSVGDQYGIEVIQPEDADGSPLVDKIEPNPQHGDRMPQERSPLPSDRIDQIKEWINQGADNN